MAVPGDDLENRFTYHPPKPGQADRYEDLRAAGLVLARKIEMQTPPSREQSLALIYIETAVMWANAAIARNE
jgi:hypothetical protein